MYKIQTLNKISAKGLDLFPRDEYEVASSISDADAILVRSAEMHGMSIPVTVKAVARAGAGTNNIPIPELTEKGVVVFNTPGANANAVKELAFLAMLLSSRPTTEARAWLNSLAGRGDEIPELAEKGKSQFIGPELYKKTLGVIGLGYVGGLVANLAVRLGMNVIGYDPFVSVQTAWNLNRAIKYVESLEPLLAKSDYISLHIPQTNETTGFLNTDKFNAMKKGVRVINLARGGLVNNADMLAAIASGKVECFVTDFACEELLNNPRIICFPHLGASTPEAEDNCAIMAVNQIRNFLEKGIIENSVNFPKCVTENEIPAGGTRLCIAHRNMPGMMSKFSTILGEANLNVSGLLNQSRGDYAYNIIDIDGKVDEATLRKLAAVEESTHVRRIEG